LLKPPPPPKKSNITAPQLYNEVHYYDAQITITSQ